MMSQKRVPIGSEREFGRYRSTSLPRLSPRRRILAERLAMYLESRGGKVLLPPRVKNDLAARLEVNSHEVDQAAEDLYALGTIEMRTIGETLVLVRVQRQGAADGREQ
jgi:hypothetical protein